MKTKLLFTFILLSTTQFAFSQWTQQGIDINGEFAGDLSGYSVSLSDDGSIVAIGVPGNDANTGNLLDNRGYVRIYQWNGAAWDQMGQNISGEASGDFFGYSVSLSADGSIVAIGAPYNDGNGASSGHVRIYQWDGVGWNQLGIALNGEAGSDESGNSVSLSNDGSIVAIGSPGNNANGASSGQVRIYQWNGASWNQLGIALNGTGFGNVSGWSVSLSADGSIVAIGARLGNGSGHVRIHQWDGAAWNQLGSDLNGEAAGDESGYSVSLSADGSIVAIGARRNDGNGFNSGQVRLYQWDGINWNQLGDALNSEASGDEFGYSVSLSVDGSIVAIGARFNGSDSGHVRIYQWNGVNWNQLGADINGEASSDESGYSVSLSADGSIVAIGAIWNDDGGANSGHVRVFSNPELQNNAFVGDESGQNNTTGIQNAFLGDYSGFSNTEGSSNSFVGYQSGYSNTTGNTNTYIGESSGYSNVTGSGNVFLGYRSGYNELGSDLLYIDNSDTASPLIWGDFAADALRFNGTVQITDIPQDDMLNQVLVADNDGNINWRDATTMGGDNLGDHQVLQDVVPDTDNTYNLGENGAAFSNIYFDNSLFINDTEFLHTRDNNVAIGTASLGIIAGGTQNVAVGENTLASNITGNQNTAGGTNALNSNTTGDNNTGIGYNALYSNENGENNTAVGSLALASNISGYSNVALGEGALISNASGSNNLAIGYRAMFSNVFGDNNTAIGNNANTAVNNLFNTTAIGNDALTTAPNQVRIGNAFVNDIGGYASWTDLSDGRFKKNIQEDIPGLAFIRKLRPVSYILNRQKLHIFLTGKEPTEKEGTISNERYNGFIAQEVERIVEENGYAFNGVKTPQNEKDHYGLKYAEFVVPLTKAVQELSALVEAQQQKIAQLEAMVYGTGDTSLPTSATAVKGETTLPKGFLLEQNIPNPFNETTTIIAALPETVNQAKIVIYSLNGIELQSYPIGERGRTTVEIKGGSLQSGMYLYALLADGQLIDTKKMILTK